ncbi:MAG: IMP dehydrogenase [Desulfurococcales archaeon]|nr:IMP dehydrogenase [Desulfurococcales archaeon]
MKLAGEYLTFDDTVIVPGLSPVEPHEVDITGRVTRGIHISIPVVSSPMDTVTEGRMAIALARMGAVGVIHRNLSREEQASMVKSVKEATPSPWIEIPRAFVKEEPGILPIRMAESGSRAVLLLDGPQLVGILLDPDADPSVWHGKAVWFWRIMTTIRPMPSLDSEGRLLVGAAVSPYDLERAQALERAGADFLVTDVAHLHNENALRMLSKLVKNVSIDVVAGNLGTREAVLDVLSRVEEVGGLRMGISSGSICSTGEVAGAAVPTLTAVLNARSALEELGAMDKIPIIADGGIRNPGDAAKAIIAGASSVMLGRFLAGTLEAPGPVITVGGRRYKPYRGMASRGAMERRHAADRYSRPSKALEEGVEGLVEFTGSVVARLGEIALGLQAALGYAGAPNMRRAWSASLARVTPQGRSEVKPHDVIF